MLVKNWHAESVAGIVMQTPVLISSRADLASAPEGQCDCACSTYTAPLTHFPAEESLDRLVAHPRLEFYPVDDTHYVVFVPSGFHIAVTNQAGMRILQGAGPANAPKHQPLRPHEEHEHEERRLFLHDVAALGFLVPSGMQSHATHSMEAPSELVAWIHVTNQCNLRCHYCYLKKTAEAMSIETAFESIEAVFRSAALHSFHSVKLKYAGGEPSLNFDLVKRAHAYAIDLARENGVEVTGIMLSNGVGLTRRHYEVMAQLGLRLMISLDGLSQYHDSQRVFENGAGSFKVVLRSVLRAKQFGVVPDISITVSSRTVAGLPKLLSLLLENDLPFSINYYRENEHSLSHEDLRISESVMIEGMLTAFKVIERNLPRRSLLPALVDRANLTAPHDKTCGVGVNYLVIDQFGNVSKCQMDMGTPVANIRVLDPLELVIASERGIINLSVDQKTDCQRCKWKYWCAGGCALSTFRATGRYDLKSPNCSIYKALYPEAVRLEGLRLLKYAS